MTINIINDSVDTVDKISVNAINVVDDAFIRTATLSTRHARVVCYTNSACYIITIIKTINRGYIDHTIVIDSVGATPGGSTDEIDHRGW